MGRLDAGRGSYPNPARATSRPGDLAFTLQSLSTDTRAWARERMPSSGSRVDVLHGPGINQCRQTNIRAAR